MKICKTRNPRICVVMLMFLVINGFSPGAKAQPFGNEWIQYQQKYFAFPVSQDGIYRISFQTIDQALQDYGLQLSNIPVNYFQVWGRGEQIPLRIVLGNDGQFNPGDYIEFFARGNDGWFDEGIYQSPDNQVNKRYSLFNDTARYFFSWNATGNNARWVPEQNTAFPGYSPQPYVWKEIAETYTDVYLEGLRYNTSDPNSTLGDPAYTGGEGFSGNKFWVGQSQVKNLAISSLYSQGPGVTLSYTLVGGSNRSLATNLHRVKVQLGQNILTDTAWQYYHPLAFQKTLATSAVASGSASVVFSNIEVAGQNLQEWTSVPNLSIRYPRSMDYSGVTTDRFIIPVTSGNDFIYLRFSNIVLSGSDSLRLYDLTNHRSYLAVKDAGYYKVLVRDFPGEEECLFIPDSQVPFITALEGVHPLNAQFIRYDQQQYPQVDYVMLTDQSLALEAHAYAQYRENEGYPYLYKPMVAEVAQVYDQFGYGIAKSPLSIRNFLRYLSQQFNDIPGGLFLLGKAYQAKDIRKDGNKWKKTLVPVFGYPPSDWMYTFGLLAENEVAIPVGRLSAATPADVSNYLEKIKAHEQLIQQPALARKSMLQFSGGSNFFEQGVFRYYTEKYDSLMRGPFNGYSVSNFYKSNPDPVVVNQSEQIREALEEDGVSMINYFGHASGISFDLSIGDPGDFDNKGKYYFVVANSCWAGDMFDYHGGLSSERYVLLPEKGAAGFLASVTEGEYPFLHAFTKGYYKTLSGVAYGKSQGRVVQQNINQILQDSLYAAFQYKEVCLEMSLHADPAMTLYSPAFPDYDLTPADAFSSRLSTIPAELTTELDSFQLLITPANAGKALDTLFFIRIERWVDDGLRGDTLLRVAAPYYLDTLIISMPVDRNTDAGLNRYRVSLDALHEIDENGLEGNNQAELIAYIRSSDIIPVMPADFAIVPSTQLYLRASTSYPFLQPHTYLFQLDTSFRFDSPLLRDTALTQGGGVLSWNITLPLVTDSMVYYWRVGLQSGQPDSVQWRQRSFQYIQGKSGWSQARFQQMDKNLYNYIQYQEDPPAFAFVQDIKTLIGQTFIVGHPWQEEHYKLNYNIMDVWSCAHNRCYGSCGIKFAVFNPVSFEPWISYNTGNGIGPYGNKHCRDYPVASFDFCTYDSSSRVLISQFIAGIPDGHFVLAFSHINHRAEESEESLYQAFESIGAYDFRFLQDTSPYVVFGIKGAAAGTALEAGLEAARDSLVKVSAAVETNWDHGTISSPLIGPAKKWHSMHWRVGMDDKDVVFLSLLGVRATGQRDTLRARISTDSLDIENLADSIPADTYPWLQLVLVVQDTSTDPFSPRDPAYLQRWQVIYEGIPETAIDPSEGFSFYRDTIQEGDSARLLLCYHNLSELDMDSLLVVYWLKRGSSADTLFKKRLRPHPAGDVLKDSIAFPTKGLNGWNQLWVELNPYDDQPELTHLNNLGEISFLVQTDQVNPLLELTFDGVKIRDHDFVSPDPLIEISLSDENSYLRLTDTSAVQIWLQWPGQDSMPVYYQVNGSGQLLFTPASAGLNRCTVLYNPAGLVDGTYLLVVRARDASGLLSGKNDYRVHFRVKHSSSRSELVAWPNPFSLYTRFAFILTGSALPRDFSIQIYDLAGRPVRLFSGVDFGPVHIGTNYARRVWDGTDNRGNLLPNGMYLFRVTMTFDGDEPVIDRTLSSKDRAFKDAFQGKLIISR